MVSLVVGPVCDPDEVASLSTTARSWSSLRTTVVGELLSDLLAELGPAPLCVVDAGGGTGGFAVPLAAAGHHVTVVDPSPGAMAALRLRAAEQAVIGTVTGVQGDLAGLLDVVPAGGADLLLCHNVLEVVEDVAGALATVREVLRPGGLVSFIVPSRGGAVLARSLAGRFAEAAALLDPAVEPGGVVGFTPTELHALVAGAGLSVEVTHAIRVFSDLVPGAVLDGDPAATAALLDLERIVAGRPDYLVLARQLHVVARRPEARSDSSP
jgi:S-adenosylmethionine-dependent methyltransferase